MTKATHRIHLMEVASTNAHISQLIQDKKLPEFTILSTDSQPQGRGHGSNRWETEPGKNLILSTVWYPDFVKVEDQFQISMAVSLATHDLIATYVENTTIKWPNDLYINNKKAAGILIEHAFTGPFTQQSIIGIGLNVNQKYFSADIPNPISLRLATGQNFTLGELLDKLSDHLQDRYLQMKHQPMEQRKEYMSHLYLFGIWAEFESKSSVFQARITGINPFGWLELEHEDGLRKFFAHKEVQFR